MTRRRVIIVLIGAALVVAGAILASYRWPIFPEPITEAKRTLRLTVYKGAVIVEHAATLGDPPERLIHHDLKIVKWGARPLRLRDDDLNVVEVLRSRWVKVSLWLVLAALLAYPVLSVVRSEPARLLRSHLGPVRCAMILGCTVCVITILAVDIKSRTRGFSIHRVLHASPAPAPTGGTPPPAPYDPTPSFLRIRDGVAVLSVTTTIEAATPQSSQNYSFGPIKAFLGDNSLTRSGRFVGPPPGITYPRTYGVIVSLWLAAIVVGAYPLWILTRGALQLSRRRRRGLCITCGYDLTGNTTGVCPECAHRHLPVPAAPDASAAEGG